MVWLKHGLHAVCFLNIKAWTNIKYVRSTIATFDNCDGKTSGVGVTHWVVCLCELCLSNIKYALLL